MHHGKGIGRAGARLVLAQSRLSLAISQSALDGVDGKLAVFRPTVDHDLSPLADFDVEVITGFFPDNDQFQTLGFGTRPVAADSYGGALVFLPRAKAQARDLIAQAMALTSGGPVLVDGQKTDGVDSMLKACRSMSGTVDGVTSKSHGKFFILRDGDFSGWTAERETKNPDGFWTAPGVFSADGIDPGSAALAAALPKDLAGRIADLGAGWGYLSQNILTSGKVTECHLVEAEHAALECAKRNVSDARAQYHWADAGQFENAEPFDHVVTNPPFHTSRAADPELGRGFITAAARLLRPRGTLWLVANRHLPYEQSLSATFTSVEQVAGPGAFKVFKATGSGSRAQKTVKRRRR